jgi:hypothetical protein
VEIVKIKSKEDIKLVLDTRDVLERTHSIKVVKKVDKWCSRSGAGRGLVYA